MMLGILIPLIAGPTAALLVDVPPKMPFHLPKSPYFNAHRKGLDTPANLPNNPPMSPLFSVYKDGSNASTNISGLLDARKLPSQRCTQADFFGKEFEIVVYGATGFTGNLAAQYLAAGHPDNPTWAIAARSKMKLEKAAEKFDGAFAPQQIHARLDTYQTLLDMTSRSKVILNYAGPYEKAGSEALIYAALQGCAHYIDVSMEPRWNAAMFKKYGKIAKERGVAIVQSAGFTSLPSDLLAMAAIKEFQYFFDAPPHNVKLHWTRLNGGVSRGVLSTEQLILPDIVEPYGLSPDVPFNERLDINPKEGVSLDSQKTLPDHMNHPDVNLPVIHRSIHNQYPGAVISVHETVNASVEKQLSQFLAEATAPIPMQPVPGEGPSHWALSHGSFEGSATAMGKWPGVGPIPMNTTQVTITGSGDPSFAGTAKMSTELALGISKANINGGYYTPSDILGVDMLEERLTAVDSGQFISFNRVHSQIAASVEQYK